MEYYKFAEIAYESLVGRIDLCNSRLGELHDRLGKDSVLIRGAFLAWKIKHPGEIAYLLQAIKDIVSPWVTNESFNQRAPREALGVGFDAGTLIETVSRYQRWQQNCTLEGDHSIYLPNEESLKRAFYHLSHEEPETPSEIVERNRQASLISFLIWGHDLQTALSNSHTRNQLVVLNATGLNPVAPIVAGNSSSVPFGESVQSNTNAQLPKKSGIRYQWHHKVILALGLIVLVAGLIQLLPNGANAGDGQNKTEAGVDGTPFTTRKKFNGPDSLLPSVEVSSTGELLPPKTTGRTNSAGPQQINYKPKATIPEQRSVGVSSMAQVDNKKFKIGGYLRDGVTGVPISKVRVTLGAIDTSITNANGWFEFHLPIQYEGDYVSFSGDADSYHSIFREICLKDGATYEYLLAPDEAR
jgi:hypothetical protein